MSGFGAAGAPPAPTIKSWQHLRTGKVRDLYTNDSNEILLVASDRISAFDWVLPTTIPNKGAILTQLSLFWFELLEDIVPNHIISDDVPDVVSDRAVIVKPLKMFEIECVARGYLTGSGLKEYQVDKKVCGIELPDGLVDGSQLPTPIFTPATKAAIGDHDINIDFETAAKIVGAFIVDDHSFPFTGIAFGRIGGQNIGVKLTEDVEKNIKDLGYDLDVVIDTLQKNLIQGDLTLPEGLKRESFADD